MRSIILLVSVFVSIFSAQFCAKNFDVSIFDTIDNRQKSQFTGVDYVFDEEQTNFSTIFSSYSGFSLTTIVRNDGQTDSLPGTQINLYLSKTTSLGPASKLLKSITVNYFIKANSSSDSVVLGYSLPAGIDNGRYYLILEINTDELNEEKNNNILVSPEIQIAVENAPDISISSVAQLSGSVFRVQYSVLQCQSVSNQSIDVKVKLIDLGGAYGYKEIAVPMNVCNEASFNVDLQHFGITIETERQYHLEFHVDVNEYFSESDGLNNYFGPYTVSL